MKIDLHNYPAFFLDHHEGNLNSKQEAQLQLFLNLHPELLEEFNSFEFISLNDDLDQIFPDKSSLKKTFVTVEKTEQLVALLEGDLDNQTSAALQNEIALDKQIKAEWDLIQNSVLSADHSIQFKDKQKLKKRSGILVQFYSDRFTAIAALFIILLVGWALLNYTGNSEDAERTIKPTVVDNGNSFQPATEEILTIDSSAIENRLDNGPENKQRNKRVKQDVLNNSQKLFAEDRAQESVPEKAIKIEIPIRVVDRDNLAEIKSIKQEPYSASLKDPEPLNNIASIRTFIPQNSVLKDVSDLLGLASTNVKEANKQKSSSGSILNDNLLLGLVSTGAEGITRITGKEWVSLDKQMDDEGQVKGYEINTPLFSFSRTNSK